MKQNRVFRFLSSVKLAVPLMLILAIAVGYGTIVESRYNTDMARLTVYRTTWFQILLILLWINIFCATLSRIPFKVHHTGFVITHIGLLTLLIGSMITNVWGIDGQLQVAENSQNDEVTLPELALQVINRETSAVDSFPIERRLQKVGYEEFKSINDNIGDRLSVVGYIPFAKAERVFKPANGNSSGLSNVAVSFRLKSAFFDVTQWLQSEQNPEMQLGPAHLSLVIHKKGERPPASASQARVEAPGTPSRVSEPVLQIFSKSSGEKLKELPLRQLKGAAQVGQVKVSVVHVYEQAMVGGKGKIVEGGQKGSNPALELDVSHDGQSIREVVYAKYPTFTLHNEGIFGFTFRFLNNNSASAEQPAMPQDDVHARFANKGSSMPGGNKIQFHIFENSPDKVMLKLIKGGTEVLARWVKAGEMVQTPWMGMQITLNELVVNGSESQEVKPTELTLRTEMPPSALLIKPAGAPPEESAWLIEGDARDFQAHGSPYQVYFGHKTFKLPFQVFLEKFTKKDYPGTQTPMAFESLVKINNTAPSTKIFMNEPLNRDGYTLYQASYLLRPGETPISVFSVNWDPGRWIKYIGSLILVVGIITFTLMRSRLVKKAQKGRS